MFVVDLCGNSEFFVVKLVLCVFCVISGFFVFFASTVCCSCFCVFFCRFGMFILGFECLLWVLCI